MNNIKLNPRSIKSLIYGLMAGLCVSFWFIVRSFSGGGDVPEIIYYFNSVVLFVFSIRAIKFDAKNDDRAIKFEKEKKSIDYNFNVKTTHFNRIKMQENNNNYAG